MLERGELLTMEEFFEVWTEWKNTKYHTRKHRGLSDAGEKWVTPIEMFENGPRYEKAAPPREYAAMLLMKAATARVTNQGINKFGTLYTDTELAYYVNQKVNIKWDIDDVTKLYVYDMEGKKICEAVSAELLAFGPHCSQAALEKHLRDQKRNEREVREYLEERVRPYELRLEDGARPSDAVGMIDLTIKATPSQKLVSLPKDRMVPIGTGKQGEPEEGHGRHLPQRQRRQGALPFESDERIITEVHHGSYSSGAHRTLYQHQPPRTAYRQIHPHDALKRRGGRQRDRLQPHHSLPVSRGQV